MKFFLNYLKDRRRIIGLALLFCVIFLSAFALYHLPIGAVLYPACVCLVLEIIFILFDLRRAYKKHKRLAALQKLPAALMDIFPFGDSQDDDDYLQIIQKLIEEQKQTANKLNGQYMDMVDYYTIWAHQIKTPIAAMHLTLQNEDTELSRKLSEELFRIEQYVEMVLCYLRLGSDSTDYVIRLQELDDIVKQAIRKFSSQFIRKRIRLVYEPLHKQVITDEKWLQFVIEQILSNAIKYTRSEGSITIDLETPDTLCIRDTGIGIAPEDLPRIFEKGYTGYNGRRDKKASGIGLYLCKRICDHLGHNLSVNSSLEAGTVVRISLARKNIEVE